MVFHDRPLLDVPPDFDRIESGQLDDFTMSMVAPGAGTPWKETTAVRRTIKLPFLLATKLEWKALRDFFVATRGNQRGFWLPTWITDYETFEHDQGGTAVKIAGVGLSESFVADEQFAYLALINAGQIEPHEIANITGLTGGDEQLNTATPIAADWNPLQTVCCPLLYCRLADDVIKYRYVSDGVVAALLEFEELPQEYETAHEGTTPFFLYEFTRGAKVWRMTNWPEPLVLDDVCWSPENIRHGAMRLGVDFISEELEISVATDLEGHPFREYLSRAAYEITDLSIWESNGEAFPFDRTKPIYRGRVGPADYKENGVLELVCSSIMRLGEVQVPTKQAQRTCNHRFGDRWCAKDIGPLTVDATVSELTIDYVEADEFEVEADAQGDPQWFALGRVWIGTEVRMVVGQHENRLYADEPFHRALVGQAAQAAPGCNKRVVHCNGRYANIENMLAFPYTPNGNPQFEGLFDAAPAGGKKE
jgi:hypothetical protein